MEDYRRAARIMPTNEILLSGAADAPKHEGRKQAGAFASASS